MEPPVTLSIINMSKPTISYPEAYERIRDCCQRLLDHSDCELQAEDYALEYSRLDHSEERYILANVYNIIFDAESELANIDEDNWHDPKKYDECCAKLEWYFNNGTLDNYL